MDMDGFWFGLGGTGNWCALGIYRLWLWVLGSYHYSPCRFGTQGKTKCLRNLLPVLTFVFPVVLLGGIQGMTIHMLRTLIVVVI